MQNFAQSFLIDMLGSKFLLEPDQAHELTRGIEMALAEDFSSEGQTNTLPIENLLDALERLGLPDEVGVVNLLKMPLSPLWVRAELKKQRRKLVGLNEATILVVGLWANVKGKSRRTAKVESTFCHWRDFVEAQLLNTPCGKLDVVYLG